MVKLLINQLLLNGFSSAIYFVYKSLALTFCSLKHFRTGIKAGKNLARIPEAHRRTDPLGGDFYHRKGSYFPSFRINRRVHKHQISTGALRTDREHVMFGTLVGLAELCSVWV